MARTVFLDLDGVLADFDRRVLDLWGEPPGALEARGLLWSNVQAKGETFWSGMPLALGAGTIVATSIRRNWTGPGSNADPVILTGTPRSGREAADVGKREWVRHTLGRPHLEVITGPSSDKPKHIRAPGDILVDDRLSNIQGWTHAGGVGVYWHQHPDFMDNNFARLEAALAA